MGGFLSEAVNWGNYMYTPQKSLLTHEFIHSVFISKRLHNLVVKENRQWCQAEWVQTLNSTYRSWITLLTFMPVFSSVK